MRDETEAATGRALALACSITADYTLPLLVALASLRSRLPAGRAPVLHLIHAGLPARHLDAIACLVDVRPVALEADALAMIPAHRRFPREAAAPLLLGSLLPADVDRVLFLDADTLVLDDPEELWRVDLAGRALGAVVDDAIPRCSAPRGVRGWKRLGVPPDAPYFNAGVMAISLDAWRERDVARRALGHLVARAGGGFLHQEALNATVWDDWLPLEPRWNLLGSVAGRRHGRALGGLRPGIVHFAGRVKPWRGGVAGPFADAYRIALQEVRHLLPPVRPTPRDRALSAYDRRLRSGLYPVERALWTRGLI